MDMNEAQSKALERGLNDATALSQDEWRGVALAMMAQCQPWYEELERLRGAAEGLEKYVTMRRDDTRDSLRSGFLEGAERWCAAREGDTLTETLDKGRELGLWK